MVFERLDASREKFLGLMESGSNLTTMNLESNPTCYRPVDHVEFFVGWPVKPPYKLVMEHFETSQAFFLLNDDSEVLGFVSALTDNALYAFIALLEVREFSQGKGHGKFLIQEMLKSLAGIYAIDLVCDADVESFYRPFGFTKQIAMSQRNREVFEC